MKRIAAALVAAGALSCASTHVAHAAPVMRISFDKHATAPGVWDGTATGPISGPIHVVFTQPPDATGTVWHIAVDWSIAAGEESFTAHLVGTLNWQTDAIVLDGSVTSGYLAGDRAHLDANVDPSTLEVAGTLQIEDGE